MFYIYGTYYFSLHFPIKNITIKKVKFKTIQSF